MEGMPSTTTKKTGNEIHRGFWKLRLQRNDWTDDNSNEIGDKKRNGQQITSNVRF
jgi:hypothetical protein